MLQFGIKASLAPRIATPHKVHLRLRSRPSCQGGSDHGRRSSEASHSASRSCVASSALASQSAQRDELRRQDLSQPRARGAARALLPRLPAPRGKRARRVPRRRGRDPAAGTNGRCGSSSVPHALRSRSRQHQLGIQLRTLYEQGDVDPLAVVFGAASLSKGFEQPRRPDPDRGREPPGSGRDAGRPAAAPPRPAALASDAAPAGPIARVGASRPTQPRGHGRRPHLVHRLASLRAPDDRRRAASSRARAPPRRSRRRSPAAAADTRRRHRRGGGRKMVVSATCYILKGTTASGCRSGRAS